MVFFQGFSIFDDFPSQHNISTYLSMVKFQRLSPVELFQQSRIVKALQRGLLNARSKEARSPLPLWPGESGG
jgi:hypothetical protein